MMSTVGIIGYGNMGEAIYHVLEKAVGPKNLYVADPHQEKLAHLLPGHGATDPSAILSKVEVVILAVKPQSFSELAANLSQRLKGKKVLSIMTGVTLDSIKKQTGATDIVRAMPNLPLRVGLSLTAWIPSQNGSWAIPLLSLLGDEVRVQTEEQVDAMASLSGSGPAYFYYMCEMLATKAEALGFDAEQARKIAEATFVGSAELLWNDIKSAAEWRQAVTSKGGITAAAIKHLESKHFPEIFHEAIDKAKERATELRL